VVLRRFDRARGRRHPARGANRVIGAPTIIKKMQAVAAFERRAFWSLHQLGSMASSREFVDEMLVGSERGAHVGVRRDEFGGVRAFWHADYLLVVGRASSTGARRIGHDPTDDGERAGPTKPAVVVPVVAGVATGPSEENAATFTRRGAHRRVGSMDDDAG